MLGIWWESFCGALHRPLTPPRSEIEIAIAIATVVDRDNSYTMMWKTEMEVARSAKGVNTTP
jgi:hypothetical protein